MTKPHQSTDDFDPVANSPQTSPDPWSQNEGTQDYQAGLSEGRADSAAGQRPTFMDNSYGVSDYVRGYAEGYSAAQPQDKPDTGGHPGAGPRQNPDVPRSMDGDSGQAMNDQEAQRGAQVARASRISRGFVSTASRRHPDFRKAYAFASKWEQGRPLVATGSAYFEAGLYAGISDREPDVQRAWLAAHEGMRRTYPYLRDRISRHAAFSVTLIASGYKIRKNGVYAYVPVRRTAGTTTDLISDGPGTSPDPMGSTPLNGPGTPPPSGGRSDPARSGGPSPYQGAQPQGAGPVVQDDVQGLAQEPPQPVGPVGQGFSGPGPGYTNEDQRPPSARGGPAGADLAPAAPDAAAQQGYSNPGAYQGNPEHKDKVAVFRATVQASLKARQATGPKAGSLQVMAALEDDLHTVMRMHRHQYAQGQHFSPDANIFDLQEHLRRIGRPAGEDDIRSTLTSMQGKGSVWPGAEWDTWSTAG
jgi:hypothetical protein